MAISIPSFLNYCEQYFLTNGAMPSLAKTQTIFSSLTLTEWDSVWESQDFQDKLQNRGLPTSPTVSSRHMLTEEQLVAANIILDENDRRSKAKKLQDLEIPTLTWQGWMRDPLFSTYLRERSEAALHDRLYDVHSGVLDRAVTGDTNAAKLVYELTGRHVSGAQNGIDLGLLFVKIVEVLSKYVPDPQILTAVADELGTYMVPSITPVEAPRELSL